MLQGAALAFAVVSTLVVRAIAVPSVSAFFGGIIGFIFPETTQAFMQYINFEAVAFWQLMLLVGAIGMVLTLDFHKTNSTHKGTK